MNVVIVGGGIVGTAIASRLGETDHDVTLFERADIGRETTAASAGIVMRAAVEPEPFDLRLRSRARSGYRDLLDSSSLDPEGLGVLYVAETPTFADRLAGSATALREYGVDASFVEATELAEYGIEPARFAGALYTPADTVFDEPGAIATAFADRARRNGVDVRTGVAVTNVETTEGAVSGVVTDEGRVEADRVVNATGPWAPRLNEAVGVSLPLCHTKGPMVELEAAEPIDGPVTIFESNRYVRPGVGTDGTRAWIGEFLTTYVDGQQYDPDTLSVPDEFVASATELATDVPALADATVVDSWIGLRTVTPDGRPIVGETSVDGFVVACGMTGHGITLAPAVADVVGEAIDGEPDPDIRDRLSPDRFS
ncbi:NAD(P)/FAD-dependent oxidoreductase [Halosolutus amylolyticus]|uniref:NAD(P)/FAD-dependent oxidoreductase n=1 Tax=Halosolutus amylolyticus TaxID=2932267 RepID=A0ABD5PVU0_9EURY|nr:FAD-dependent oxidoreductase [Halosolutus amylolyticus]